MATHMSSAFVSADRRKKAVTYGKSSRLPSKPSLPSRNDAPSPERPRKHTVASSAALSQHGPQSQVGAFKVVSRGQSPDVFDMPSEEETTPRPPRPTKKLPTKRKLPVEHLAEPAPSGEATKALRLSSNDRPQKRSEPAPPPAIVPVNNKTFEPSHAPRAIQGTTRSSGPPNTSSTRGGRPIQAAQKSSFTASTNTMIDTAMATVKTKGNPRTTNSKSLPVKLQNRIKADPVNAIKGKSGTSLAKQPADVDVFDLLSSDDEVYAPTPSLLRSTTTAARKEPTETGDADRELLSSDAVESDGSSNFHQRKRKGPIASATIARSVVEQTEKSSLPQRNRKYQKKEDSVSPGHGPIRFGSSTTMNQPFQPGLPAISKPSRTRIRTVPVIHRAQVTKGQSSPANLHSMLRHQPSVKSNSVAEAHQDAEQEDETMYDIPEPNRLSSTTASGSVTPRQKALFGSLLGTPPSASTPMPNLSKLQLTAKKPTSLLGSLSRSKSDVSHGATSRQTKLIDRLKQIESYSEEDVSGSDDGSDSGEEPDDEASDSHIEKSVDKPRNTEPNRTVTSYAMNVDSGAGDSQTSQANADFTGRHRLTYAKSRSYLQESNPEDALLLSMDLDEAIGFGSQKRDSREDENEEEETSQVRANHELKRQGQQNTFEWEMLIDDISARSSTSVRRSAMLEFCTKMADEAFAHQLLDSTLAQRFLKNISATGEVVFNFVAMTAIVFMLRTHPTSTMVEQIHESISMHTMRKLLEIDIDIQRIARDRKTNLSRISQESVKAFRAIVQEHSIWYPQKPLVISPQLLALKALELYLLADRKISSVHEIVDQDTIVLLAGIASKTSNSLASDKDSAQYEMTLELVFSILEAVSLGTKQNQPIWSTQVLQTLARSMAISFDARGGPIVMLAAKLCMNLTNNKPKACEQFSEPAFVQSLGRAIVYRFEQLQKGLADSWRSEVLDSLILSLGAMINLTEHSDEARLHVDDGEQLIETIVNTFLEGSARAAQADSMEESQSSVAVGYLSVLLGNMCLNDVIRPKVREHLPDGQLTSLIEKIREFVSVHEHVNRKAKQYEGEEGQQTWQEYTRRLMHVVKRLERVE